MNSLHTGCKERVLILLESDILYLYIKGIPGHPKYTVCKEKDEHIATYIVRFTIFHLKTFVID